MRAAGKRLVRARRPHPSKGQKRFWHVATSQARQILFPFFALRMRIGPGVVLVVVDLVALFVLLMLYVRMLPGRQLAAIRRAIVARLVVDFRLIVLDVRTLARRQLPGLDSAADALLLAILACVHTHALRVTRIPMVERRPVAVVLAGNALMRHLFRGPLKMLFVHRGAFLGRRPRDDAPLAVEAGAVDDGRVADHGTILVHAVEAGTDAHDRGVISERPAFPASAVESDTAVAVAIVDSAVVSDARPPIARAPSISASRKAPIAGRPQQPRPRRSEPHSRHPEVTCGTIGPVAGRPQ